MKQNIYLRLFKAIKGKATDDIVKVAYKIIKEESEKGHVKLAKQLTNILEKNIAISEKENDQHDSKDTISHYSLRSMPVSKRQNTQLVNVIERDQLRHSMILATKIEDRFTRIEKEYIARDRLAHSGLKPKQKILLYGPPGCGKTMGAERIAWNIGLPLFKIRFESIISSYLGESANNLRILFESIKNYPCVLLLDEFDFIAKSRTYGQDVGEMYRLVNMMLYLLDEYNAPGLLIATTNLEGAIDKAIFRRFDEVLMIPKPGSIEIERLLKLSLSSVKVSTDIRFKSITKRMDGFSSAQVVKVAQDASKLAIITGMSVIHQSHIDMALSDALEKVSE